MEVQNWFWWQSCANKESCRGISASFQVPEGDEAVKNKAAEEKLEEREMVSMGHENKTFDLVTKQ